MSAKISRTFLALLCILIILQSPPGTGYSQAFSARTPDFAPDDEISQPDIAETPEPGDELTESEDELPESESGPTESEDELPEPEDEPTATDGELPPPSGMPQQSSDETAEPDIESEPEPDTGMTNMAGIENLSAMYGLEPNERVVKTFAELKGALDSNNGITTVYLGRDIEMQGGIHISGSKPHVIIDGFDPTNPNQLEPYTLTDIDSAAFTETVYLTSDSVSYIHVRDLKITGKNFYGPFSVIDSILMSKVKLIFERVDYNGPQFGYHRQGTVYVIDCKVRIHGGNGILSPHQEFSEAKALIFEGVNTIDTETTSTSIFWHPLGGAFTVADDSSVTLTSPNTSGTFGMFYADGAANEIDITVGRRSAFDATILNSVAPTGNASISSLAVREGGSFSLTTTGAANRSVLSVRGDITVEPESEFKINSFGGGYPALALRTGDITVGRDAVFHITSPNTNSALLNLYGRSLICDDPESVLLYNPDNRDILATNNPGRIFIGAEQINYWKIATKSGFDNPPLYQWKKADATNFRLEGVLGIDVGGNLSGISSNYTEGDSPGTPPDGNVLDMVSARVLAFGRLELMVNTPVASSEEITGVTAPGAFVRASFYSEGVQYITPEVKADTDGAFVIPIGTPLRHLTDITVMGSHRYLTAERAVFIDDLGGLTFTVPDKLRFYTAALAPKTQTVKRLHANWQLVVSDTRGAGNTWSVYVRELQPLTTMDTAKPALEDSLVFVDDTGAVTPLSSGGTLLVYRRTTVSDSEMVNIGWTSERGILARIPTGAAYSGRKYTGIIEWSLTDAP